MSVVPRQLVVVGAGIVGLCSALSLQRAGAAVTILDPLPPGMGASFGNAGFLSADQNVPLALPGMWRQVPGWLLDPLGPLVVRPSYLPTAVPWLARWLLASRMKSVLAASDALRALHRDSHQRYMELLGPAHFADLIRNEGSVHVFEKDEPGTSERVQNELMARHGITPRRLSAEDLRDIYPDISARARRGLLFERNGFTINPSRLTATLAELFRAAGGTIACERVMKLIPRPLAGFLVMTNGANRLADAVVVAAGAHSKRLLDPLKVTFPLDTERGYHLMLGAPSVTPRMPLILKDRGIAVTPMEHGLRLAGTVEIAGLEAAPDERRASALLESTRALFPTLQSTDTRIWMGFRPSLPDSVPAIGAVPGIDGLFVAAGHGHTGMVGASETGMLVRALVLRQKPAIDPAPYALERFGARAVERSRMVGINELPCIDIGVEPDKAPRRLP